ncbi:hypothetical protein CERZMDRAFT_87493 [Cercospora zeae-maydis SCOH1-5]|uniref:Uncharacterized protein n=1 Tax=Cercospora zeae-maydis SCOH1-5 TaxID=717836 RepID=A0A6A6F4F7_9PEZI|nr:hypothetical protein CERZMDRAFT_87493 [Cercospora zeae-maydis SCOH1-5]
MPMSRAAVHDPFTTSSTTASSLRSHHPQTNLRSHNASSAATARTRQPAANLFAPSLLRRPTSRTTPRVEEDVVLPDSDSEADISLLVQTRQPQLQQLQQTRRTRHGSPDTGRHGRLRPRQQAEEQDLVNRQPDGSYLLGACTLGIAAPKTMFAPAQQDGEGTPDQEDTYHRELARRYFTSGAHISGRHSKTMEDGRFFPTHQYEQEKTQLMAGLRTQVMHKLEDEKWLYEASDRFRTNLT